MSDTSGLQLISLTVQGKNETFSGYINMSMNKAPAKPYDETGAAYYVIAVVLVYGLSMVLLIGSLAKKNMKNTAADHDERQVSRYLEKVPSLKELSARQQFKELKSNIIRVVSTKTPIEDLNKLNNTSVSDERDLLTSGQQCGLGSKKVSFSSDNNSQGRKYSEEKAPRIYIGSREILNNSDASASENSPLLGQHGSHESPLIGSQAVKERKTSESCVFDSESEAGSPVLKPKLKLKSSWGETRVYEKPYNKSSYYQDLSSDGSPVSSRKLQSPQYRTSQAYYQYSVVDTKQVQQQSQQDRTSRVHDQHHTADTKPVHPQSPQYRTSQDYYQYPTADTKPVQPQSPQYRTSQVYYQYPTADTKPVQPQFPQYRTSQAHYKYPLADTKPVQHNPYSGGKIAYLAQTKPDYGPICSSSPNPKVKHSTITEQDYRIPMVSTSSGRGNAGLPVNNYHSQNIQGEDGKRFIYEQPPAQSSYLSRQIAIHTTSTEDNERISSESNYQKQPRSSHIVISPGKTVPTKQGDYFYCKYCDNKDGAPALCSFAIEQSDVAICNSDDEGDKIHVTTL